MGGGDENDIGGGSIDPASAGQGEPVAAGGATEVHVTAAAEDAGARLDRVLVRHLPAFSRARLQALIRAGAVTRDGVPEADLGRRVRAGEAYVLHVPPPGPAEPEPQVIPLDVVYEDKHLIVINKPRGLTVHPAPGHASGTLVNALLAHCGPSLSGIGGVLRPGIVHRLDKDTTGLLVAAKTDAAHRGLSEQFAAHGRDGRLERAYRAIAWGVPDRPHGTIEAALSRSAINRTKIAVVSGERGRNATTRYEVLETFPRGAPKPVACLLRLVLETGRTHQVRVHLAYIGHPLLGDSTYGAGFKASARKLSPLAQEVLDNLARQALHAAELAFVHPVTGKRLRFTAPLPPDMAELVAALKQG